MVTYWDKRTDRYVRIWEKIPEIDFIYVRWSLRMKMAIGKQSLLFVMREI